MIQKRSGQFLLRVFDHALPGLTPELVGVTIRIHIEDFPLYEGRSPGSAWSSDPRKTMKNTAFCKSETIVLYFPQTAIVSNTALEG